MLTTTTELTNKFEEHTWRYSIFNDDHFGIIIAKDEQEAKRKLRDNYWDDAMDYQHTSRPTIKGCDIELWKITDDDYYGNGIFETS